MIVMTVEGRNIILSYLIWQTLIQVYVIYVYIDGWIDRQIDIYIGEILTTCVSATGYKEQKKGKQNVMMDTHKAPPC